MRRVPGLLAVAGAALMLASCAKVPSEILQAAAVRCPPDSRCYDVPRPDGPGGAVAVEAGEFFFRILGGSAMEGPVRVSLRNTGGAEHTFTINEAFGNTREIIAKPGTTEQGTLELFAGDYTFFCSVPGHRQQGMEGRLKVLGAGEAQSPPAPAPPQPPGGAGAATPSPGVASPSGSPAPASNPPPKQPPEVVR